MDRRFTLFAILVAAIFVANQIIYSLIFPPPPRPAAKKDQVAQVAEGKKADAEPAIAAKAEQADDEAAKPAEAEPAPVAEEQKNAAANNEQPAPIPPQWVTIGSADPADPYRMLVTFTNRGAAIVRLELSSPRYRDVDDRSGYLGHFEAEDAPNGAGARAQVVGAGTPAALAGMQPGDVITAIDDKRITTAAELIEVLEKTEPHTDIKVSIEREGAARQLTARLGRRPLEVMRPEFENKLAAVGQGARHDPFSFLLTLEQFDDKKLADDKVELEGVDLIRSEWEVASIAEDAVTFRKRLPKLGLEVHKSFLLDKVPADQLSDPDFPAYHLWLDVKIVNVGSSQHRVAYRLDGPTGLPIEGAWYANKVSRGSMFSAAGLRDVVTHFEGGKPTQVTPYELLDPEKKISWPDSMLDYCAVDAQYFAAAVIPQRVKPTESIFADVKPTRVGAVPSEKANQKLLNVSFMLESMAADIAPDGEPLAHRYQVFAGPKRPGLLVHYEAPGTTISLGELVYYGWFGVVARPMLLILHGFHYVVGNYGLAIIMLTVLVRGCMVPLSRKQALGMQKMQELQPEMKRLNEKYKNEPEKRTRATQDLFRQHNYNPVGGCMLALVQTPILMGLYRSLMVDVELRDAPLVGESIRWASNLSAPDMLWKWVDVMPQFIASPTGFLGPYLNIFPLLTIGLFIWQQKTFTPPPADEQAALQQKMMQYMMIFVGVMFFKVASGLCVYFIASSLWGIAERKLLPKALPKAGVAVAGASAGASGSSNATNGAPSGKKRQRGRK